MLDRAALGEFAAVARCDLGKSRVGVVSGVIRHATSVRLSERENAANDADEKFYLALRELTGAILSDGKSCPLPLRSSCDGVVTSSRIARVPS